MTISADRRYICRHEHQTTRGWIARPPNSPSKLFSFAVHGGVRAALAAARAWRDDVLAGKVRQRRRGARKRARPGYGYVKRALVKGTDVFVAWLVVDVRGRTASTTASVAAHGVAGARKACEAYLRRKRREYRLPTVNALED